MVFSVLTPALLVGAHGTIARVEAVNVEIEAARPIDRTPFLQAEAVVYAINAPPEAQNEPEWDDKAYLKEIVLGMVEEAGMNAYTANQIITCESSWRIEVWNYNVGPKSYDVGIWQINDLHGLSWEDRTDPIKATDFAIELYKRRGWQPWVCAR